MVILPNPKDLTGITRDVHIGGPWVEAFNKDHPIIIMPVAPPHSTISVVPEPKGKD